MNTTTVNKAKYGEILLPTTHTMDLIGSYGKVLTCESASVPATAMKSACRGLIFYSAGRNKMNTSQYSNFGLETWETQEGKADTLVGALLTGNTRLGQTDSCATAAKAFSCALHFPYCPYALAGVSHIPACQTTCLEVQTQCGLKDSLDCSTTAGWRANGDHCFQMPNSGAFLLDSEQGPYYNLPGWYVSIAFIWTVLMCVWLYLNFRTHTRCSRCHACINPRAATAAAAATVAAAAAAAAANTPPPPPPAPSATRLHRFMVAVPLIKVIIVWFAAAFWIGCESNGLCSFWIGVLWVNMQLIYETSYILVFVLISKGWCITTQYMTREQWRSVLMSVCIFYMAESMLLVFKSYLKWSYWMFTAVLYFSFIASIYQSTASNVAVLQRQLDLADGERLNVLAQLLLRKLMLLRLFQYLLCAYAISELLVHLIFDAGMKELNTTIVLHEGMFIFSLLGVRHPPVINSPFCICFFSSRYGNCDGLLFGIHHLSKCDQSFVLPRDRTTNESSNANYSLF